MFRKLDFKVQFSTTGRTMTGSHSFENGFTTITGPNESGKSMIFEMLRYALFGTTALRGTKSDYDSLSVDVEFDVRGKTYTVHRDLRKAYLDSDGSRVATQNTPVNAKITNLLGFGIKVFDVNHSVNQGEIERLGNMAPTERRLLIDRVVGLDVLDNVVKWAAEEGRVLNGTMKGMEANMVQPIRPDVPTGYQQSDRLAEQIEGLKPDLDRFNKAKAILSLPAKKKPEAPTEPCALDAGSLAPLAEDYRTKRLKIADLNQRLARLSSTKPTYTDEDLNRIEQQWDGYTDYSAAQEWLNDNPIPQKTVEQLQEQLDRHENKVLGDSLALALGQGSTCEECGHVTPSDPNRVAELKTKFDPDMPEPDSDLDDTKRSMNYATRYDFDKEVDMLSISKTVKPSVTLREVKALRKQAEEYTSYLELAEELRGLVLPETNFEELLEARQRYERLQKQFLSDSSDYMSEQGVRNDSQAVLQSLDGIIGKVDTLRQQRESSLVYESQRMAYEKAIDKYNASKIELANLRDRHEKFTKARTAMGILRGLVKAHLVPSLNRVASHLLDEMTGGQRRLVVIDEDFDVMIDGQPLHTLSGSGKSVANLAIRIGLGQVLTNSSFSVLLADEIDAAMDAFRAEKTVDVLRMLEKHIGQVILISHKPVTSEHTIELGAN
jgi:exonuclease SbcC